MDLNKSVPVILEYPQDNLREVLDKPFRLIYIVGEESIDIVTIKHYRQRLLEKPADL